MSRIVMAGNSRLARQPLRLIPFDLGVIYSATASHCARLNEKFSDVSRLKLKIFALRLRRPRVMASGTRTDQLIGRKEGGMQRADDTLSRAKDGDQTAFAD